MTACSSYPFLADVTTIINVALIIANHSSWAKKNGLLSGIKTGLEVLR